MGRPCQKLGKLSPKVYSERETNINSFERKFNKFILCIAMGYYYYFRCQKDKNNRASPCGLLILATSKLRQLSISNECVSS